MAPYGVSHRDRDDGAVGVAQHSLAHRAQQHARETSVPAGSHVELCGRTVEGPARRVLLAASHKADLLVLGARRNPGHIGLQLARVAHAVLHHAACAVAVVPERA